MSKFKTQEEIQEETFSELKDQKLKWHPRVEFRNTKINKRLLGHLNSKFLKDNNLIKDKLSIEEAYQIINQTSYFINSNELIPSKLNEVLLDSTGDKDSMRFVQIMKDNRPFSLDVGTSVGSQSKGQHFNISGKYRNLTGQLDDLEIQVGSGGFKESQQKGADKTFSMAQNVPFTNFQGKFTDVSTSCVLNQNSCMLGNNKLNEFTRGLFFNYEADIGNVHAQIKNCNHQLDLNNKDLSNSIKFENSDTVVSNKIGLMFKNNIQGKIRSEIGHFRNQNDLFFKLEYLSEYKIDFCSMFFTSHYLNTGIYLTNNFNPIRHMYNMFHLQDLHGCKNIGYQTNDNMNYLGTNQYISLLNRFNFNIGGLFKKGVYPYLFNGVYQGRSQSGSIRNGDNWHGSVGIGIGFGTDWLLDVSQSLFDWNVEGVHVNNGLKVRFYPQK